MIEALEKLLVLQDRDRRLRLLRRELKNAPLTRKSLEERLAEAEAAHEKTRGKLIAVELEKKRLEVEAGSRREQIGKYKAQQFQTRKNEEFQALGNEIKRFEADIQSLEDRELELMQQAEDFRPEIAASEASLARQKTVFAEQIADLEKKVAAIGSEIAALESERGALTKGLDEDLLDRFERLFATKGEAVVPLEHGVCMGCHMKVTTQTAARVKTGRELVNCEQCGRMLYAAE